MIGPKTFFDLACERYQIHLNKEAGCDKPWTDDKIFQTYRFCNVFREDDKTTRFIRQNVTYERHGDRLLGAMIIARWFNRIETLELLLGFDYDDQQPGMDLLYNWGNIETWRQEMHKRLKGVQPIIGAAYFLNSPAGMKKLEGIMDCLGRTLPTCEALQRSWVSANTTLHDATMTLTTYPYMGTFKSYEVVTDMRHTPILDKASDIMTWANPGPGCARGISRLLYDDPNMLSRSKKSDLPIMQQAMEELLVMSQSGDHWPQDWPAWEMRDVEHMLCETDKYQRVLNGEGRPKQKYPGAV